MNIVFQSINKINEKRTVIGTPLYPNYGSYLAEKEGFELLKRIDFCRYC